MKLVDGLSKLGFRKWYERELLQSHAHLALCFMCLVGVFAAFEALVRFRSLADQVIDVLAIALCTAAGLWSLRRYLYLLGHAEMAANQADCPKCGTYGRLLLLRAQDEGAVVHVRCKSCGHEWPIES
jgi:hypothetical protein